MSPTGTAPLWEVFPAPPRHQEASRPKTRPTKKSLPLDDDLFPSEEEEDITTEESDGANGEGSPRAGRL